LRRLSKEARKMLPYELIPRQKRLQGLSQILTLSD